MKNYAFIDGNNLYLGLNWRIDYARFTGPSRAIASLSLSEKRRKGGLQMEPEAGPGPFR